METVYKTGHQSAADPLEFIMSDESVDRLGDIIEAKGWTLSDFKKNPIALFGHNSDAPIGTWKNVRIDGKSLKGVLELAEPGTTPLVDGIRRLIEQRILKAVSVGFRPIEREPINKDDAWGPQRFKKQLLLECSVVSVPANPNALSVVKDLALTAEDRAFLFAKPGAKTETRSLPPAKSGARPPPKAKPMTIAERIRAAQDELLAIRDQLVPLAKKVEDGDDLSDEESTTFTALNADCDAIEKQLSTLRMAERSLAGRASTALAVIPSSPTPAYHDMRAPAVISAKHLERKGERPADLLFRMALCHFQSHVQRVPVEQVRMQRYGHRDDLDAVLKAVTNPAMTSVAGWAAELVQTAVVDFLEVLRPVSAYGALASLGVHFSFDGKLIKIPRRVAGGSVPGDLRGAFVGEGAPIPVRRGQFTSATLSPFKMGVISTYTREMATYSTPQIEGLIRDGIVEDTALAIDTALLDSQAATAVRPAGLGNGVTPLTGTAGGGVAAVEGDIKQALAPFAAANASTGLVWLINPAKVNNLRMVSTAVGVYPFKEDVNSGNLAGYPLIASTMVPITQLWLVRYADFASASGDSPEFDVSDTATIHEDDGTYAADQTATQPTTTVKPIIPGTVAVIADVPKPVRSLWQTASIGIRMLLDISWVMRRSSMVQIVSAISW